MRKEGYIYLLEDRVNKTYKIGRTKDLKRRISALRTGNPNPIELVSYALCADTVEIEKRIHLLFSFSRRRNKEWFDLSTEDLDKLKTLLRTITTDFKHERNIDRYFSNGQF